MTAPSITERNNLRAAIRKAPLNETANLLKGRRVNELAIAELRAIAAQLGGAVVPQPQDSTTGTQDNALDVTLDGDEHGDQLANIKDLIMNGGFSAADDVLRKLIADACKPAQVIEVPAGTPAAAAAVQQAKPTTATKTWGALFGVRGDFAKQVCHLWDGAHPETPVKEADYVWPAITYVALSQIARGEDVFLFGPPGTGKTTWVRQLAATLGRPFAHIACDDQTDAPTVLGMTVPAHGGGTVWQDGVLTKAIQTPGCVICIDEPSIARAGALMVFQTVLEERVLYIAETGRRVPVAKGVIFVACDNTNGTGGGARHGLAGTQRLNAAFLDRFSVFCKVDYLSKAKEAAVIVQRTGCTHALAELLIGAATTTRQHAEQGTVVAGISLRRLFAWAGLLTDGVDVKTAFECAVLNCCEEQDREAISQQCLLTVNKDEVSKALKATQSAAAAAAAEEFVS